MQHLLWIIQCKVDWSPQILKYLIPSLKCFHKNNKKITWVSPSTLKGSVAVVLNGFLTYDETEDADLCPEYIRYS